MPNNKKYEFDEEGNLKILKELQKRRNLQKSTRTLLLLSNRIIEINREIVNWDSPNECNIIIKTPPNFNSSSSQKPIRI